MKYYKLNQDESYKLVNTLKKIKEYEHMVLDWLRENYVMDNQVEFIPFNDIPEFTDSILRDNPVLKKIMNKTNSRVNQRSTEGKLLIKNWQEHKKKKGYKKDENYTRIDYVMILRSLFPFGSVTPCTDKDNYIVLLETSEQSESKKLTEISRKEFLEQQLRLEEN